MFTVTTKYDKVPVDGKEVRKKVFLIRGDEAYARTTDTVLTYSTPVLTSIKGLKTTLTATVHRNIGASTVVFYDGEEVLDVKTIGNNVHTVSLSDIYLSYDVEHNLYAVFNGNKSCLKSRSKTVSLKENTPSSLNTVLTFNNPATQVLENDDVTFSMTAKVNGENVADGTPILVYDNDTYIDRDTTSDGYASVTIESMTKGKHTIRAVIETSSTVIGATNETDVSAGYDLQFTNVPSTFINGTNTTNTVTVRVLDWFGSPVNNATVSLTNQSNKSTNSSGLVSFNYASVTNGSTITATSGGSSISRTVRSFTPSSITLTPTSNVVGYGESNPLTISMQGSGYTGNSIRVTLTGALTGSYHYIDGTPISVDYTGKGNGTNRITATCGDVSNYVDIGDYLMYYTPTREIRFDYNVTNATTTPTYSSDSNGFLIGKSNTRLELNTIENGGTMEFDVVSVGNNNTVYAWGMTTQLFIINNLTLQSGDNVKITSNGSTMTMYLNGESQGSTDYTTDGKWVIQLYSSSANPSLKITNLKVYK